MPSRHRYLPLLMVLRALVAPSRSWLWADSVLLIFLAFTCRLRPVEAQGLSYAEVPLTWQLMADVKVCYVKVRHLQARWAVARREHAWCDEVALVRLLEMIRAEFDAGLAGPRHARPARSRGRRVLGA